MAGVRTEYLQAKPGKSRSSLRGSSISHSSNQRPQSALRSGKYDTSNSKLNELKFDLSVIYDIYGYDATLYEVLSVNRNANAREIKAAYLNKGRELLLVGSNSSQPSSDVPDRSQKEFQAVSLAYQILSKEDLRALYDGRCNVARKNSVQWSNVVQEKVIKDAHPDEHSHRRKARRTPPIAPPVYDDGCTELDGLDEEIDELMYYCNDDGGVNFVDLDELQGLVHILNTSIKEKRTHLLESFDSKFENERQPSEEAATREGEDQRQREGEDQRQPPAQSEDDGVIQAHKGGTYDFVCDAVEEAIFPVKGNISEEVGGKEFDKSTVAIAVAATTAAAALVKAEAQAADPPNAGDFACKELGALAYGDDDNDLIESGSNQEAPHTDDPANKTSNCEPEESTTNSKQKQTMKLRKMTSRRNSNSLVDANAVEKSSTDDASDEAAADTTGTSTGWFACCGASEAFANDNEGKIEGDNTAGIDDTAESTKDNAEDAAVDAGSVGAAEKSQNDKTKPSMKLRKAMSRKLKSRKDTEDQKQPAKAVAVAAGASASWFACFGVSEAMANDNDDGEITTNDIVEKKEKSLGEGAEEKSVAEGDFIGAEEKATKHKTKPSTKLRKAMISRMKTKSLLETEDQEPSAEAEVGTNAGWFTCCGAPEALANDNDGEMPVNNISKMESAKVELVEENLADEDAGGENEEKSAKNKTKPSMKLRKKAGRRKTKLHLHPTTEIVATTADASAGWSICCGASEALTSNDDISEMTDDMEATSTNWSEEQNIPNEGLGDEAEIKTAGSKSNPSKKLLKTVSIRSKTKNSEKKPSENAKAEEEELAMPSFFSCCGSSEATSDKIEDTDSVKVDVKTQNRVTTSARKLRNQWSIRKKTIRSLLDTDENDATVIDADQITANVETKQGKSLKMSLKKKKKSFNRS